MWGNRINSQDVHKHSSSCCNQQDVSIYVIVLVDYSLDGFIYQTSVSNQINNCTHHLLKLVGVEGALSTIMHTRLA